MRTKWRACQMIGVLHPQERLGTGTYPRTNPSLLDEVIKTVDQYERPGPVVASYANSLRLRADAGHPVAKLTLADHPPRQTTPADFERSEAVLAEIEWISQPSKSSASAESGSDEDEEEATAQELSTQ